LYNDEEDFSRWMKELSCYIIRDKISQSFKFLRTLGEGSFGKVFLARRLDDPYELVAVKVLDSGRMKSHPQLLRQFLSEIEVHWALESCDGMLGLQQIFEDQDLFYLVLDY
jgi:serine/threonine protein kinase